MLLRIISKNNSELAYFINEIEYLTDFQGKSRFYTPKTIDELLSDKLIYLVGCSVGDGHINKEGKRWTLVDGSSNKERLIQSKIFVEKLSFLLRNYVNTYEIKEYSTKFALRINNKSFCRFLNFYFALPFGKKKDVTLTKPLILSFTKKELEKYFWRGCFDTDGSVNKEGAIDFCSSDKNLLLELKNFLKKISIKSKKKDYLVSIPISEIKKFVSIGFFHPRKQIDFLSLLKRGPKQKKAVVKNIEGVDKDLIKIIDLFRIDNNYRIRVHKRLLKERNLTQNQVSNIIKEKFNLKLKDDGTILYFKSKKIYNYLKKLVIYEDYWKPINNNEKNRLLMEWNKV